MKNKPGILIVLSGPSGCGKGTVIQALMEQQESLFFSVSATTRTPRPGEEHGKEYYFLTKEEFEAQIINGEMLEHATYVDHYYGTPRKPIEQQCAQGQDVILDIEVQGAMQVMEQCPEAVSVFIVPPSMEELRRRLIGRQTEPMDVIENRLATARTELQFAKKYDYIIVNDSVEAAAAALTAVICAEKSRSNRMLETIQFD